MHDSSSGERWEVNISFDYRMNKNEKRDSYEYYRKRSMTRKKGVILEYVNFTKEFAEIKEYVRSKGESIRGYTEKK